MLFFLIFLIAAIAITAAIITINHLVIRKSSARTKGIFRIIIAIAAALIAGGIGFFFTFALGEGLGQALDNKLPAGILMLITFGAVSIFNFVLCLLIGKFYSKSIWFAWFLINPIVWLVIIMNPREAGGLLDLWWGWTALIVFAFAGSVAGLLLSRKKQGRDVA